MTGPRQWLTACALAFALVACIHRLPPQRLAQATPIAVSMLEDRGDETRPLPDEVRARIAQDLEERNLVVRDLSPAPAEGGARNSQQRFAALDGSAGDAAFSLLIETRVAYYDLLEGQYRWVVYARLTAGRRGAQAQPATDETDIPVFLQFSHEKEDAALAEASRVLAERAAALIDGFIATPKAPGDKTAPRSPYAPNSSTLNIGPDMQPAPGEAVRALGNVYFVLIDRFANGDKTNDRGADLRDPEAFHGGDLQGVLDRLDGLQKLGVQTIWLSPVFASRQEKFFGHGAYHGYWVEDLNRVEPRFGDLALLQKLSAELHRRGMKLLLDLVLNHVAFDSPLLAAHPDWFHHNGSIEDWNDARQLEERDVNGLPDLAQENEQVYRSLLDSSFHWIDTVHPDGFRLDAVKHVPLAFWKRFNDEIHAHAGPAFVLLGEALEGSPAKLSRIERAGGFDSLFDFPLAFALGDVFCKGAEPERLASVLSLDRLYSDARDLVTLVDNHDLARAASICGGDANKLGQLFAALGYMRGVPAIQYGTEAALAGEKEPQNRGDLFERSDLRAAAAVGDALRLHASAGELRAGRTVILAAGQGAVALARTDGETVSLLLYAKPGSIGTPAIQGALRAFAGVPMERCLAFSQLSGASEGCALAVAPGELRLARLRPARTSAIAWMLRDSAPREIGFRADALHPNDLAASLYVAGAGPELGDWDPARAVGPLSSARSIRLPANSVAEYKLILKKADGSVQWESGPDRFLFIDDAAGPLEVALGWKS